VAHPPVVHSTLAKLSRAELSGVNAHTLPVALARAERDNIPFDDLDERQMAIALLERCSAPETAQELSLFLGISHNLTPTILQPRDITDQHAPHYVVWIAGFLNDPDQNVQKNARILLRWVVANRQEAIAANPQCLDGLRRLTEDSENSWRNAAFIAYALGVSGAVEDYDRVIHQAEIVIEHDREHADLVAEALYRLHPPALINALQYFLEHTEPKSKQFHAGVHLLAKVAEIDDQAFWNTYFDDMAQIVDKLSDLMGHNPAVERILDLVEKHLALASDEDS
jgi:hypothetical protein